MRRVYICLCVCVWKFGRNIKLEMHRLEHFVDFWVDRTDKTTKILEGSTNYDADYRFMLACLSYRAHVF